MKGKEAILHSRRMGRTFEQDIRRIAREEAEQAIARHVKSVDRNVVPPSSGQPATVADNGNVQNFGDRT